MIASPGHHSHRQKLVVIGAGMTTYALLRRLFEAGGQHRYAITVVGEEPLPCYDRVNLTECFSGKRPEDLLLAPRGWYDENDVQLLSGTRATEIDRRERTVRTSVGRELPYDQLVIATGSRPFVPPIAGVDLPGVFLYRTVEDIERIRNYAVGRRSAAVLGGGLLGLEAGKALHDLDLEAHIVEVAPGLMPRQLDAHAAALLKSKIEKLGVRVHLPRRAERIELMESQLVIHFVGHEPLPVDMVVVSAGIRPEDALARQAGLACGQRGGIDVDAALRTDDPQIFAIGECVCFEGDLFGLVGPCYEMANVLAYNLAAKASGAATAARFAGASKASRLKLMGVEVSTLGAPIGEAAGAELIVSEGSDFCRSLLIEDRRLVGAIAVGNWPEREHLSSAIIAGRRLGQRQLRRFRERGFLWSESPRDDLLQWPATSTVCACLGVTRGDLSDAMMAGAATSDELSAATGAATVCGSCRELLCRLVGSGQPAARPKGRGSLLVASCAALIATLAILIGKPMAFASSVQSSWRSIDFLWQQSVAKQATGYTLLGVSVVALLLSLRKRISWITLGDFGTWRGIHGILGAATLIGFLVHTGMRMGHNFTFVLALSFLLLNLLGAVTGIAASLESRLAGAYGRQLRQWRPRLTRVHIWMFWPIPALVVFHIISVYYY